MAAYDGSFTLTQVINEDMKSIVLPGEYHLKLQATDDMHYDMSIRVGNSMGGRIDIVEPIATGHKVSVGPIRSTMMMPPKDVFNVEMALTTILPEVQTINLQQDILTLEGVKGKVVCQRDA